MAKSTASGQSANLNFLKITNLKETAKNMNNIKATTNITCTEAENRFKITTNIPHERTVTEYITKPDRSVMLVDGDYTADTLILSDTSVKDNSGNNICLLIINGNLHVKNEIIFSKYTKGINILYVTGNVIGGSIEIADNYFIIAKDLDVSTFIYAAPATLEEGLLQAKGKTNVKCVIQTEEEGNPSIAIKGSNYFSCATDETDDNDKKIIPEKYFDKYGKAKDIKAVYAFLQKKFSAKKELTRILLAKTIKPEEKEQIFLIKQNIGEPYVSRKDKEDKIQEIKVNGFSEKYVGEYPDIPALLKRFTNLKVLRLDNCFRQLQTPLDLSALSSLQVLEINGRSIPYDADRTKELKIIQNTEMVKAFIQSDLPNLTSLSISYMYDELPYEYFNGISRFAQLESLSLYMSNWQEMPDDFWELKNIRFINIINEVEYDRKFKKKFKETWPNATIKIT